MSNLFACLICALVRILKAILQLQVTLCLVTHHRGLLGLDSWALETIRRESLDHAKSLYLPPLHGFNLVSTSTALYKSIGATALFH